VTDAWTILLGPLAAPECSRASRRGWLIWVRMLPAFAAGAVAFVAIWAWWVGQRIDPTHQPLFELRMALMIIEGMVVAFAMIMAPAVLAGSLAGEKERGSIGLLLTTRVNSADIVLGRLAGRLSQVAMIEMAAVPALLMIASMAGLDWVLTLSLLALPAGLALGGGGIALGASAISRRGRDALLFVYLVEILFLLSPLLATWGGPWIGVLSPYHTISSLTGEDNPWPSLATAGAWAALGILGLVLASWRLRPSCLSEGDDARSRKRAKRRGWVPPMDDERPMLWKELYIERVGTLGRAGRWIGGLLVLWLTVGSLALGACVAWGYFHPVDSSWADWAIQQSSIWYGGSAMFIGFLIQWAIGLRAAVTISSERERGTWDALLTSPLEGTEIVRGKLWGSLWALKWLVGSALLAWTITFAIGGMFWPEYVEQLVGLLVVGTFMSAVGVRTSLRSPTATRAMGITIGFWLGANLLALAIAAVICVAVVMLCVIGWLYAASAGLTTFNTRPWFPMSFRLGQDLLFYGQFIAAVILVVVETRLRFDRVAGRMTGGATAVAIDHLIHGVPMAPVKLGHTEKATEPELDEVAG
jgi:ABC-type transport system involved in multi-copper enzyme maturation permease subunit